MQLILRLSTKLIDLHNMITMELEPSSKFSNRDAIFIKGTGLQIEIQYSNPDFNALLFFMMFWHENQTGQIEDIQLFYEGTLPILPPTAVARFDKLKSS